MVIRLRNLLKARAKIIFRFQPQPFEHPRAGFYVEYSHLCPVKLRRMKRAAVLQGFSVILEILRSRVSVFTEAKRMPAACLIDDCQRNGRSESAGKIQHLVHSVDVCILVQPHTDEKYFRILIIQPLPGTVRRARRRGIFFPTHKFCRPSSKRR